jgi:hypothetical protein
MMIETQEYSTFSNEMASIIAGNVRIQSEFTNEAVMEHVKDKIDEMGGFVDILSMYEQF